MTIKLCSTCKKQSDDPEAWYCSNSIHVEGKVIRDKREGKEMDVTNRLLNQFLSDHLKYIEDPFLKDLILFVKDTDDERIKSALNVLLSDLSLAHSQVENLQKRLADKYSDPNVENLLDKLVLYNPKFSEVSITPLYRSDETNSNSCYLDIPVKPERADDVLIKARQVLKIIIGDLK